MTTESVKSIYIRSTVSQSTPTGQIKVDTPTEVRGNYVKYNKTWMRNIYIAVDFNYNSVPAVIEELTKASAELTNTAVKIEQIDYYGSTVIETTVAGQRPATKEERVWILRQIQTDAELRKQAEAREIERFRQKHPDLLK